MELEEEFQKLLSYHILGEQITQNLFDIGGIVYSENRISNWYAFFLETDNEHNLSNLFLDSFIELINEKSEPGFEIEMDGCSVIREYATEKGRIDLVIYDGDLDNFNSAIIVENKINATLDNDLDDYFSSIRVTDKKIGVVLSLNKIECDNKDFINITHYEISKRIKNNLPAYLVKANDKHLLYLKDFLETIESISKPLKMDKDIKFYIKNIEQINKLIDIKEKAEHYIVDSISNEVTKADFLQWSRKNKGTISLLVKGSNLRIYIGYNKIFDNGEFELSIWLNSKEQILKLDNNLQSEIEERFSSLSFDWEKQGDKWLSIGRSKHSDILEEDLENIGQIVVKQIKLNFSELIIHLNNKI